MALTKVTYTDGVTVIMASNLNAIQDEIIANGNAIANLDTNKVDKVNGKGLSTNDFTDALLQKLNAVENGATHVVVDSALDTTSDNPVKNKAVAQALADIATDAQIDALYE